MRHKPPSTCSSALHPTTVAEGVPASQVASLQSILAQISEGYVVTDAQGIVAEANAAAASILGGGDDPRGESLRSYVEEGSRPDFVRLVTGLQSIPSQANPPCPLGAVDPDPADIDVVEPLTTLPTGKEARSPRVHEAILGLKSHDPAEDEGGTRRARFRALPEWEDPERLLLIRWLITPVAAAKPQVDILGKGERVIEHALSHYAGFFEHLTQSAEIAIAVLSAPDFRYEYANPYLMGILGPPGGSLIGRSVESVLPEQAAHDIAAILHRACVTGKALRVHAYEAVMAHGQPVTYWDVEAMPLLDPKGQRIVRVIIVGHDVSEQVREGRKAVDLAAQNRAILDSLHEGVIVSDLNGTLIAVNPAARDYLGIPADGPIPATLTAMSRDLRVYDLTGRSLPHGDWPLARLLREAQPVSDLVLRVVESRSGREWVSRFDGTLVQNAAGVPEMAVLTFRDVTAQVTAEQERQVLFERLEKAHAEAEREARRARHRADERDIVLRAMTEAVVMYDARGVPVLTNPAAARMYGHGLLGADPAELDRRVSLANVDGTPVTPDSHPVALALAGTTVTSEHLRLTAQSETRTISITVVPLRRDGAIVGAVSTCTDVTERERLLAELHSERSRLETERARLRATLDALPVGVVITDAVGNIIERSDSVDTIMHGMPPLADVSLVPHTLLQEGEGSTVQNDWSLLRALRDGTVTRGQEVEVLRFDGTHGVVMNAAAPIVDLQGNRLGAVVTMQDVTELQEAREDLRRLAERLEALRDMDRAVLEAATLEEMASSALPWLRSALSSELVSLVLFDKAAHEMLAHTVTAPSVRSSAAPGDAGAAEPSATVPRCVRDILPLEDALLRLLQGGILEVDDMEDAMLHMPEIAPMMRVLVAAGVQGFAAVPLVTHQNLLGALVIGLRRPRVLNPEQLAVAQEVAAQFTVAVQQAQLQEEVRQHAARLELRVAERTAELQTSEARFRAIFSGAAMGIAVVDLGGYILQVNPAGQEMIGYSEDELIGLHFSAVTDPAQAEGEALVLRQFLTGESDSYRGEKRFSRKDGRVLWTRIAVNLVPDATGEPSFILGLVEDITARREAEEALIRAEKLTLTGQLAASLAHEVGNPLQVIVGCLGLVREALDDAIDQGACAGGAGEAVLRHVSMAVGETHRAAGIVQQLRDLNRHSQPQARQLTDLRALVEKVLALGEPEARRLGVDMTLVAPEQPGPMVFAAEDQLHQVFLNLVLNAIEAMPDGGQLDVKLEPMVNPAGAAITFRDTGIGISEEGAERVFEAFYTTKQEGLGLGLYVTHSIIENHGGTIDVKSVPGEGTTFRVWLPG